MTNPDTQTLSDSKIRSDIRAILALPPDKPSPQGSTPRFVQSHLRNAYGATGAGFPGMIPADRAKGLIAATATRESEAANIQVLYQQWVLNTVPTLPHEDPGEATPGIGPVKIPNPLAFLQNLWSVITSKEFWIRLGEGILGVILIAVGMAKVSDRADSLVSKIPALKGLT
jgi:hypothetical protein